MAAAAQVASPARARWIIGPGVDLSLVIGSALAGYLYLLLFTVFQAPASPLWWIWSVGFDGTHIFATASRTFFNSAARREHRKLLFGSLAIFFSLGPLMVLAGLKGWLYLLVGVWAYYHVIRQHYGFLVLYKVKNGDLDRRDHALDRAFLGAMTIAPPFHRFFIHHPEELGIPFSFPRAETGLWLLVAAVSAAWLLRQVKLLRAGSALNVPKYLLLAAIVPLHWLTFAYLSWQAAVPTVTIVHNLQYHALVWFHNRNRYGKRSLAGYLGTGLIFSLLYRIPGFQLARISDLAFGFFCGFGMTHYYLDSRIWRVRHDPELREALQLA